MQNNWKREGERDKVDERKGKFLLFPFAFFSSIDGAIYSALSFPLPLWKSSELISISFQRITRMEREMEPQGRKGWVFDRRINIRRS